MSDFFRKRGQCLILYYYELQTMKSIEIEMAMYVYAW